METTKVSEIVSPAAAPAPNAASLGQEDFLRMLIAQLENQDPLNPQEATEFSSQLAQFSSLEQEIAMRSALDQISAALTGGEKSTAIDLIGRDVVAETSQFELAGDHARLQYELAGASESTILEIRDARGALVYSEDLGARASGMGQFVWDGRDRSGIPLRDGVYQFEVLATSELLPVAARTLVQGRVSSADVSGSNPFVRMGELVVPLSNVLEVRDAATTTGGVL